ncbi:MAG: tRNA pseudouridine(55) synthase TruB, partial [Clostridiales bacterium]|nr:tRNA pseudouridine(55) synthase TruB [Clostridiales bacterium]
GDPPFDYYLSKDKVYEAEFTFGEERDTLDGEGEVIASGGRIPSETEIKEAIKEFVGKLSQIPPAYSAKKIDGQKAYDLARQGKDVRLKACSVEVFDYKLLSMDGNKITVRVHCSSGTYIRSLCRDLAYRLGTYAIMTAIKRIRCGSFRIENCVTLDDLSEQKLLSVQDALPEIERLDLSDEHYVKVSNGVKIKMDGEGKRLVFCKGELFGLGEISDGLLAIKTYMREA